MPVWGHFGSIGGHFCPFRGSEPNKKVLFWESVVRSVLLMIFGHILGCLGREKQAFGIGGVAQIKFSPIFVFL